MLALKRKMVVVLGLFILFGLSSMALAEEPLGRVLVLPIVAGDDVDIDDTEQIDRVLGPRMKKFLKFDVETIDDFKKEYGRKKARRLLRCGADFKCLDKRLRRMDYDLIVLGKASSKGKRLKIRVNVYNLHDGEKKNRKRFTVRKGRFKDKPDAREWTLALLTPPEDLISEQEDERPKRQVKRDRGPKLASPRQVKSGIKASYMRFAGGDIEGAVEKINQVKDNPCGCNSDGLAISFKAMFEAFMVANRKVEQAMEQGDSKTVISNLEEMQTLEKELAGEGQKMKIKKESAYAKKMNNMFARGYVIQGKGFIKSGDYVKARERFKKALEYDGKSAEAKEYLAKIPQFAKRLYMQGATMIDFDPDGAAKKLQQVLEIADEDSDTYEKALEKLEELEEGE